MLEDELWGGLLFHAAVRPPCDPVRVPHHDQAVLAPTGKDRPPMRTPLDIQNGVRVHGKRVDDSVLPLSREFAPVEEAHCVVSRPSENEVLAVAVPVDGVDVVIVSSCHLAKEGFNKWRVLCSLCKWASSKMKLEQPYRGRRSNLKL